MNVMLQFRCKKTCARLGNMNALTKCRPEEKISVVVGISNHDLEMELLGKDWALFANQDCICVGSLDECATAAMNFYLKNG